MKSKIGILFSFIALCQLSIAQSFQVADAETGQALVGATASITAQSGENELLISDAKGNFHPSHALPFQAVVRHTGYISVSTKLTRQSTRLFLEPSIKRLDDVVITGQYAAQSAKNSVYTVRSIGSDRIENQAATSLQDVLANELNINFSRDNATGRSGLSLQGLSGQYVKVLLDGVPIVGRSGVSNDVDLGQIDIQNVERIEIVEGPMAVNYGADALAGVINIITKKDTEAILDANLVIQEESIGSEYSLFDQGLHSPSFNVGYKFQKNWYTQLNGRLLKNGGWTDNSVGREKDWYPKNQYFGGLLTRFEGKNLEVYYRLDYLDEKLENLGQVNDNNPLLDPFATDEEYLSQRWMHQLQGDLTFGPSSLNAVFSYTDYGRNTRQFTKNLVTFSETPTVTSEQDTVFYRSLFTRQTLNNVINGNWGSVQVGLEATKETTGGTTLSEGDKHLTDGGIFTSAEVRWGKLKARPGVRFTYNSIFKTTPTASINFSYDISSKFKLRWSYGRGFRAPSIRELYHEFIDSNHNLIGNPDLQPEYSHNFNGNASHDFEKITLSLGAFYNTISNLITFYSPEGTNNQVTSYTNQLRYKTVGLNLRGSREVENLTLQAGISYQGRYQRLSELNELPEFVFALETNLNATYHFEKWGLKLSVFHKFNGANKNYLLDDEGNPVLREIQSFHFLDATLAKSLLQHLDLSVGARNILGITSINNSLPGGVHGGGSQLPISNGRSLFIRINYQIKY